MRYTTRSLLRGGQRTLLAVFIGVFIISLILNTGENVINQISAMGSSASTFNIVVFTNQQERQALLRQSHTIPNLAPESLHQRTYTDVVPVGIDKQPLERLLPPRNPGSQSGLFGTQRDDVIHLLSSFEGYEVAHLQAKGVFLYWTGERNIKRNKGSSGDDVYAILFCNRYDVR